MWSNARWLGPWPAFRRSRAMPVGGRSAQLHFHSKRWCGTHVGRAQRHERWFRAPARCRSETGAPCAQRAAGSPGHDPGDAARRDGGECTLVGRSVMSAGFALPRDAGRRPALRSRASRDGMWWGIHVGRAQRHERWFRAPARCRSETGAPFRAPAGMGCGAEFTLAGRSVMSAGFALPRADRRSALPGLRAALPGGGWAVFTARRGFAGAAS